MQPFHNEKIIELWEGYITSLFEYSPNPELPYLFASPFCATCKFWEILNAEDIDAISIVSPKEYEAIRDGIEGKTLSAYKEKGQFVDAYNEHRFYGFCKRYPPIHIESRFSIIKYKFLFSFQSVKIEGFLDRFKFPILRHEQWCGEWNQSQWATDILNSKNQTKRK